MCSFVLHIDMYIALVCTVVGLVAGLRNCEIKYPLRRPPPLSRLGTDTVRVQPVVETITPTNRICWIFSTWRRVFKVFNTMTLSWIVQHHRAAVNVDTRLQLTWFHSNDKAHFLDLVHRMEGFKGVQSELCHWFLWY